MTPKEEIIANAFKDVDESKVEACKDFAKNFRDRLRGSVLEHDMLTGKRCSDENNTPISSMAPDDDALIERCNMLEGLLGRILEDAREDFEDHKGKCLVSSELIEKIIILLTGD